MDSVLLADFAYIRENDTVADLGTGNGVLPLLLYGRNKGRIYHAFELVREAAEIAQRNAILNHLEDRFFVYHADAAEAEFFISSSSVDAVVCNPPYWHHSASLASPVQQKAAARIQSPESLDHFFSGAFTILRGKGRLFMIYPAAHMLEVMKKLQSFHLEPKRFRMVYPFASKEANLVLIEAVKDAKPTLHPLPPLIIYNPDGSLTNELKSVYHIKEQTEF